MAKRTDHPRAPTGTARKEIAVTVTDPGPEAEHRAVAQLVTESELAAARVISALEGQENSIGENLDTMALVACLQEQAAAVNAGNLHQAERMLMNQATALQSLFTRLVERGMNAELLPHYEAHLRLALRAQAQCTRTLETLAAMKNPPFVFARQANIAHQQQVNNGPAIFPEPPRARAELDTAQGKLLEPIPDERLECRTQGAASGAHSELETLGTLYRPEVRRG